MIHSLTLLNSIPKMMSDLEEKKRYRIKTVTYKKPVLHRSTEALGRLALKHR